MEDYRLADPTFSSVPEVARGELAGLVEGLHTYSVDWNQTLGFENFAADSFTINYRAISDSTEEMRVYQTPADTFSAEGQMCELSYLKLLLDGELDFNGVDLTTFSAEARALTDTDIRVRTDEWLPYTPTNDLLDAIEARYARGEALGGLPAKFVTLQILLTGTIEEGEIRISESSSLTEVHHFEPMLIGNYYRTD